MNNYTNRQLIKVKASLGLGGPAGVWRQKLLCSFNLMVLTGIIAGQALGADLAELSVNEALSLTWDRQN